jgi:hypothetical protein
MVLASFRGFGSSGGNQAYLLSSHGIGDIQQAVFHPAENDIPVFAIIFTVIQPLKGKGVFKHLAGGLEPDAMSNVVLGGLVVVPLECSIIYERTA